MSIGAVSSATTPVAVAPERTPVGRADLRAAISRAWVKVTGKTASATLLDNLTAQASLETAGGAQMYNWNFGGIKGTGPGGQTANCLTHEVIGGVDKTVRQNFRAYGSIDEGAEDYVKVLKKTFGEALGKAELADVGGFAHALKNAGYYTASESDYAAALKGQLSAGGATPAPAQDTSLDRFFDSASLSRITNALSESALRIASVDRDRTDS